MRALSFVLALSAVATPLAAQCPQVQASPYGQGCNPVFLEVPTLDATIDPATCRLQLSVQAFPGCCNTFLVNYVLVIGGSAVNVPLPQFGAGCALLVSPDLFLLRPVSAGNTFSFDLPPLPLPFQFVAQGGAHHFTTIGFSHDLAITAGRQITIF